MAGRSQPNEQNGRRPAVPLDKARGDNCLDAVFPLLAQEWHPVKNGDLTPWDVTARSTKTVWWICENGHEWQASPDSRINGSGCPYCNGQLASKENSLAALNPALAAEWDHDANDTLTPEQVLPRSMRAVGWICRSCGCRWTMPIAYRTEGSGCPVCRKKKGRT